MDAARAAADEEEERRRVAAIRERYAREQAEEQEVSAEGGRAGVCAGDREGGPRRPL